MSIMDSLVLLMIFLVAYMAIIEVFTVLFRLTGLTGEKAKTQVISMLTNSGFTTEESELVMVSKRRRRLSHITMLFGYSFAVIIVSIVVNLFLALGSNEMENMLFAALLMGAIFIILLLIMRLKVVRSGFDHVIEHIGNRMMFGKNSNAVVMIDSYADKAIVEIYLKIVPDLLFECSLEDSGLRRIYDIQVLFVKRGGLSLTKIDGEMCLLEGDTVFMFGDYKNIRSLFEHPNVHRQ